MCLRIAASHSVQGTVERRWARGNTLLVTLVDVISQLAWSKLRFPP